MWTEVCGSEGYDRKEVSFTLKLVLRKGLGVRDWRCRERETTNEILQDVKRGVREIVCHLFTFNTHNKIKLLVYGGSDLFETAITDRDRVQTVTERPCIVARTVSHLPEVFTMTNFFIYLPHPPVCFLKFEINNPGLLDLSYYIYLTRLLYKVEETYLENSSSE